jgi:hypothetical protein
MAVQNTALVVFLFPVVVSMAFGAFVLSGVLTEPNRDLNMWPFSSTGPVVIETKDIQIQNLLKQYSTSTPVQVSIQVNNSDFNCGDLYITIYDNISPKDVIAQNGFFDQCFSPNQRLPIGDTFSEIIDKAGEYELVVEMNDKNYKKTASATATFKVQ